MNTDTQTSDYFAVTLASHHVKRKFMLPCADVDAKAASDLIERWTTLESQLTVTLI